MVKVMKRRESVIRDVAEKYNCVNITILKKKLFHYDQKGKDWNLHSPKCCISIMESDNYLLEKTE